MIIGNEHYSLIKYSAFDYKCGQNGIIFISRNGTELSVYSLTGDDLTDLNEKIHYKRVRN